MEFHMEIPRAVLIKTLGASITTTDEHHSKTCYSFIELSDGRIFKNVEISHALRRGLDESINAGIPVELHIFSNNESKPTIGIIAIKGQDGRLFAQEIPELPLVVKYLPISLFVAGVFLLPIFGIGIVAFWLSWKANKVVKLAKEMRSYTKSLSNAILV